MQALDYHTARHHIETGDLIAVREKEGFLTPFTRYFTSSDYTHTGIAFWMAGGLWMAEHNIGKNHAIPLSQLADSDFDVFERPAEVVDNIDEAIQWGLRTKIPYGVLALFVIGLINWLRIKVFLHARRILVCSGFSVMIYERAGWPEHTRILSPRDLAEQLKKKLEVRKGQPTVPASAGIFLPTPEKE